jgi:23S rRNA (adenine2503-C2)-methyltransferase
MTTPTSLLDLTHDGLTELLVSWGQPRYRADQVREWLYRKLATDPAQITNLPKDLRERLAAEAVVDPLELVCEQLSSDRQTIKWLFRLPDGVTIETVLMLYPPDGGPRDETKGSARERRTVCISTQAGCAMDCVFCATGQSGLARNLTAGEIAAQVLAAARWLAQKAGDRRQEAADGRQATLLIPKSEVGHLTNVVVMGMGEPFANYDCTWQALRAITAPDGFGLGARHITLSTAGLVPGIQRMAAEPLQVNLAVSLHAADDALRSQLVPINRRYPLRELMAAVRDYVTHTGRRVTFEYALMDGVNDAPAQARQLADLLRELRSPDRGALCHVNLIPLNPVAGSPYQPSCPELVAAFQATLERAGIPATLRARRGLDIEAGCGQLRRRLSAGRPPVTADRPRAAGG